MALEGAGVGVIAEMAEMVVTVGEGGEEHFVVFVCFCGVSVDLLCLLHVCYVLFVF